MTEVLAELSRQSFIARTASLWHVDSPQMWLALLIVEATRQLVEFE
jgi:hypothetical protein